MSEPVLKVREEGDPAPVVEFWLERAGNAIYVIAGEGDTTKQIITLYPDGTFLPWNFAELPSIPHRKWTERRT